MPSSNEQPTPAGAGTESKASDSMEHTPEPNSGATSRGNHADQNTTWEDVERTKTKLQPQKQWLDSKRLSTFCILDTSYVEAAELANKRAYPVVGKLSCIEHMSQKMAEANLEARKAAARSGKKRSDDGGELWADVWYARWLLRWQVFTVFGNDNIKKYRERARSSMLTREIASEIAASEEERQRVFRIEPLDVAVVRWRDEVGAFVLRMLRPGVDMGRKYAESWQNGHQQKMLERFWDGTVKMEGLKLAGKMASSIAKGWNDVADEADDNRKQT
ncbi:hypothetical protein GQ54DRAFT_176148 [Martensiomyces pterosporus]|nr:hypothetical protein GQ54DRAFT_176148 [Martensiomyces pterosporus]